MIKYFLEKRVILSFRLVKISIINTKGWDIQVQWKYQFTNLLPLSLLKKYNQFEVDEEEISSGTSIGVFTR